MFYNASYGLPYNDSVTTYPVESRDGESENFLETDSSGMLLVKTSCSNCDECKKPLNECETIYMHGNRKFCRSCEYRYRAKQRREEIKKRKQQKGGKK